LNAKSFNGVKLKKNAIKYEKKKDVYTTGKNKNGNDGKYEIMKPLLIYEILSSAKSTGNEENKF
jgi:hypothetical protein